MDPSCNPYAIHNSADDRRNNIKIEHEAMESHDDPRSHKNNSNRSSGSSSSFKANPYSDANGQHHHQQFYQYQQQNLQTQNFHMTHHQPSPMPEENFIMSTNTNYTNSNSNESTMDPGRLVMSAVADAVQDSVPCEEETSLAALAALQAGSSYGMMDPTTAHTFTNNNGTRVLNSQNHHNFQQQLHHHHEPYQYDRLTEPNTDQYIANTTNDSNDNNNNNNHNNMLKSNSNSNSNSSEPSLKRKRSRSTHRVSWEERIQQLKEYKAKHGDLLIPIRYKANPSLGKFVHNTREQYKLFHKEPEPGKNKKCSLTEERIEQLQSLGFVWSTERSKHQKEDWEARLDQLKEYKAKHGDCLVPHGYDVDPSFAEWVHRQRTTHAHMMKEKHPSPLVVERMNQLADLGFHFTVHADKWMEHWHELKDYKAIHGTCEVPTHCPENPKLGRWVHTQRHQRRLQLKGKKSCMTDERVELLNSLGFSWEVRHKSEQHPTQRDVMGHATSSSNMSDGLRSANEDTAVGLMNVHGAFDNYHPADAFDDLMNDHTHSQEHMTNPDSSSDGDVLSPSAVGPDRDCTIQANGRNNGSTNGDIFSPGMAMV